MSCGFGKDYDAAGIPIGKAQYEFTEHPRNCSWSPDGTEVGQHILERLKWTHWGDDTAEAVGEQARNHYAGYHDGKPVVIPPDSVKVVLSDPKEAGGRRYYSRMQIVFPPSPPDAMDTGIPLAVGPGDVMPAGLPPSGN